VAEVIAPRAGDPPEYVVLRRPDGTAVALTNTCAAVALGVVHADDHAAQGASAEAARRAFAAAGQLLKLDGDEVVYIAQVPSPHSMRMFTEPGRRVQPHCTAVGKALLAELPPGEARALLERDGMPAYTPATITDPDLLIAHLEVIRKQGYAVDEGEQEIGVRCFAVAVPDAPGSLAISTSGPQTRMTDDAAARIVPALQRTAREISETIAAEGAS